MTCGEVKQEKKKGPSNLTLSIGGILSFLSLAASGLATYNTLQTDIASLKRGEKYQEQTNQRLSEEIKAARMEQRETMREFNTKLDHIIDQWAARRR